MSKIAAYYHIVFCTKSREMTIPLEYAEDVYRFIWRIITDSKRKLIRIGGIQNHIHILRDSPYPHNESRSDDVVFNQLTNIYRYE